MKKVFLIIGMGLASVFLTGSETPVTYKNSDMPLYYHRTRENLRERLEFNRAWYSKINNLIRELNPSLLNMKDVFSIFAAKDGEHLDVRRNYCGDIDLLLLIEELEQNEVFRLSNEATRKETWKDLNIEKGFLRLKNDIFRQTRILEKEKFERLPDSYESSLNTLTCLYTKEFEGRESERASRCDGLNTKIRFDARLKIDGNTVCLAQRGNFGFHEGHWIYQTESFSADKIYVRRYFHVYNKSLPEFLDELTQMYSEKDYSFLLGTREEVYPGTVYLDVLVLSEDRKKFIPVSARGESAQTAYNQKENSSKIAFWKLLIGTPVPIPTR